MNQCDSQVNRVIQNPRNAIKTVSIPEALAKQIFECFADQHKHTKNDSIIKKYREEEYESIWESITHAPRNAFSTIPDAQQAQTGATDLRSIQEEERRAKESLEKDRETMTKIRRQTMAHDLQKNRLAECFKMEKSVINDIYENYDQIITKYL